jgi:hypothetical protein
VPAAAMGAGAARAGERVEIGVVGLHGNPATGRVRERTSCASSRAVAQRSSRWRLRVSRSSWASGARMAISSKSAALQVTTQPAGRSASWRQAGVRWSRRWRRAAQESGLRSSAATSGIGFEGEQREDPSLSPGGSRLRPEPLLADRVSCRWSCLPGFGRRAGPLRASASCRRGPSGAERSQSEWRTRPALPGSLKGATPKTRLDPGARRHGERSRQRRSFLSLPRSRGSRWQPPPATLVWRSRLGRSRYSETANRDILKTHSS